MNGGMSVASALIWLNVRLNRMGCGYVDFNALYPVVKEELKGWKRRLRSWKNQNRG